MVRIMATREDAARLVDLLWQQQVVEGEESQNAVLDDLAELLTRISGGGPGRVEVGDERPSV